MKLAVLGEVVLKLFSAIAETCQMMMCWILISDLCLLRAELTPSGWVFDVQLGLRQKQVTQYANRILSWKCAFIRFISEIFRDFSDCRAETDVFLYTRKSVAVCTILAL